MLFGRICQMSQKYEARQYGPKEEIINQVYCVPEDTVSDFEAWAHDVPSYQF